MEVGFSLSQQKSYFLQHFSPPVPPTGASSKVPFPRGPGVRLHLTPCPVGCGHALLRAPQGFPQAPSVGLGGPTAPRGFVCLVLPLQHQK